jgi:hypothetical protein
MHHFCSIGIGVINIDGNALLLQVGDDVNHF